MIKAKMNRIPAIARKMAMDETLVQERLTFLVHLTETLDKMIFQDKTVQPIDITVGGEGGYRIKVADNEECEAKVRELQATAGMEPWGISKSYKVNGLTVHTFVDMRFKVERYSTIF